MTKIEKLALIMVFLSGVCIGLAACGAPRDNRTRVALIDSGITVTKELAPFICGDGHKDFTGTGLRDTIGHGTNLAYIISKGMNPRKQCITSYKVFDMYSNNLVDFNQLGHYLFMLNPKYVNMSYYGKDYSRIELLNIIILLNKGSYVSVAAGNEGKNLDIICDAYPVCYNIKHERYFVVTSGSNNVINLLQANYNGPVNAMANGVNECYNNRCMSGTSQATGNWTAKLIKEHQ